MVVVFVVVDSATRDRLLADRGKSQVEMSERLKKEKTVGFSRLPHVGLPRLWYVSDVFDLTRKRVVPHASCM